MNRSSIDPHWSKLYADNRDFTLISGNTISSVLTYFPKNKTKSCLDIGCGTGQLSRELYHRGFKVLGIDASSKAIEIARSRSIIKPPHIKYSQLDIEKDVIEGTFSLITCKLVYAFIQNKPFFLQRISKLLDPGGIFVIITPLYEDVTPEKENIAVNHEITLTELNTFFDVEHYRDSGFTVYICKVK